MLFLGLYFNGQSFVEFIILMPGQEQHNAPLERMESMGIWFYKHIAPNGARTAAFPSYKLQLRIGIISFFVDHDFGEALVLLEPGVARFQLVPESRVLRIRRVQ
jgi:hypothetical protein